MAPIERTPSEEIILPCVSPKLARKIKRRNRYTDEFKQQAVRDRGERTIAQVAESLGIAEHLLHSWKSRDKLRSEPSDRGETPEEELRRLRRENSDLRKDRDALVKSIAVFVRDRKRVLSTTAPDEVWVSDITYVWTAEGWTYWATVIDLYSGRVVGWAHACHMKADLVVKALRRPSRQLTVHTDRGSQYANASYRDVLRENKLRQSMSGTGNCYDNAVAESFFASLEKECVS